MLLLLFAVSLALSATGMPHKLVSKRATYSHFVEVEPSDGDTIHELVFAIQQRNLIEMDALLMELSSPGNSNDQKWLSSDEIAQMSSNIEGTNAVNGWLAEHNITILWQSRNGEYIKAEARIFVWESLLAAKFSVYEELCGPEQRRSIHRTSEFSLPHHIAPQLSAVFHTTQELPQVKRAAFFEDTSSSPEVNIKFLKNFYRIPECPSSPHAAQLRQAVVETAYQRFSFADVARFQELNNLPLSSPADPYGYNSSDCGVDTCKEGNLNLQVKYAPVHASDT